MTLWVTWNRRVGRPSASKSEVVLFVRIVRMANASARPKISRPQAGVEGLKRIAILENAAPKSRKRC
jgi:hypothetical protein